MEVVEGPVVAAAAVAALGEVDTTEATTGVSTAPRIILEAVDTVAVIEEDQGGTHHTEKED